MQKMTKAEAEKILEQVAQQNHTTIAEVKKEIKLAMLAGMNNQDSGVQQKWSEILQNGEMPEPEDMLVYLWSVVQKERKKCIMGESADS